MGKNIVKALCTLSISTIFLVGCSQEPEGDVYYSPEEDNITNINTLNTEEVIYNYNNALDTILTSHTTRSFNAVAVGEDKLEDILLSGINSPSARNIQPWHFTVITDSQTIKDINIDAPEGVAVIVNSALKEDMPDVFPQSLAFDSGMAMQNMNLTAQALGLGTHIMMAPVNNINNNFLDILNIPEGYEAISVMLVGYAEDPVDAVANASERKPMAEVSNNVGEIIDTEDLIIDDVDLVELIQGSFTTRSFAAKPVDTKLINIILESGSSAPSARNIQPWHFTSITDYEIIQDINSNIPEGAAIIVISSLQEDSPEAFPLSLMFDSGLAVQNMNIAAQALGLGAHVMMAPVNTVNEKMLEILNIPENYQAVAVMAIGHKEDNIDTITNASERKTIDEVVNYVS